MSDSYPAPTVRIRCGCCRQYFDVPLGGSAYCADCVSGLHGSNCQALAIKKSDGGT